MYSKYERRTDTRTYDDRRKLYEGGWDVLYTELLEKSWKEKMDEWTGRAKCECQAVKKKKSLNTVTSQSATLSGISSSNESLSNKLPSFLMDFPPDH